MPFYVWSDLGGKPQLVGATQVDGGEGRFRYAPDYLQRSAPAIDPLNLPARADEYRTRANRGVFGVLADAGPDAWGRRVLTALHPRSMGRAGELDVLLMTSGHGSGALLYSASRDAVKPRPAGIRLRDLGAAAEAAHHIEMGKVLREQLRQLIEAGSSLGGMHPKVAVAADDGEWIAKFRSREDAIETPRIEWAAMKLARLCGIAAAEVRLAAVGEQPVLLVRRFDRGARGPLHYASAHALWNRERAREDDARDWSSYAGIAQLRRLLPGKGVRADSEELFRRLVFNVVIGNTDDHGRNHGFLMDAAGAWHLAPAFDVLPTAGGGAAQALGAGPAGRERSLENVLAGAAAFGLSQPKARQLVSAIHAGVRRGYKRLLRQARAAPSDQEAVLGRVLPAPRMRQ